MLKYSLAGLFLVVAVPFFIFWESDITADELKSKYASETSIFNTIQNMVVHYRVEGNPKDTLPIVLIHGTGASLHTFDAWTSMLGETKKVIRMDIPGFGLTGPFPDRNYEMTAYVKFLNDFFEKLNLTSCILAGNSLGGQIAWQYTLKYPEKVHKLILIDAAGLKYSESKAPLAFKLARMPFLNKLLNIVTPKFVVRKSIEDVYTNKSLVTEDLVDRYFDLTLREGNRQAMVDRLNTVVDYSNIQELQNLTCPTLVLWGEDDYLIPVSSAKEFSSLLPNDTLVIIKDCGHVPMEECPEKSLEAVLDFIQN
jgi:pimeloyl-ACP methyl ester carboxylesterase